jgi:glutaredoxin-related protein
MMSFWQQASQDRESRFTGVNDISPAGVDKILHSKAHTALLKDISEAKGDFKVFMPIKDQPDTITEIHNDQITQALLQIASHHAKLQPQAMCLRDCKTFVPIFDDDHDNKRVGIHCGLIKKDDSILFSFFPLASGELAVTINVNNNPHVDMFMHARGKAASYTKTCCAACGIATDGRLKCGACRRAVYCGKQCQKGHWQTHRTGCGVDT